MCLCVCVCVCGGGGGGGGYGTFRAGFTILLQRNRIFGLTDSNNIFLAIGSHCELIML